MEKLRRNKICLLIIFIGIINLAVYTIVYSYIGGDAKNGYIKDGRYYLRGHFLRYPEGKDTEVSRSVWIYSYLHSISIWPTIAAILISTIILARPHIIVTMQEDTIISGQTFITIFITTVVLIVGAITIWFVLDFIRELSGG